MHDHKNTTRPHAKGSALVSPEADLQELKIAIVHDFLLYPGGAERVLRSLADMFPAAPIYTLLYDKEKMRGAFEDRTVYTSFLQKFPSFWRKRHRWLLPFMPSAPETFDLRDFDLVITSSSAWSKGIVTKLHTKHIAYIHSPMRFAWDENVDYVRAIGKRNGFVVRSFLSYLRVWDYQAAQRPDVLIANSQYTQKRIEKYYRRGAEVVYPPVNSTITKETERHTRTEDAKEYFLIISRLSPYKNTALAIEVCNKLKLPLVVVGEGKEYDTLKALAGSTVRVVGYKSDKEIAKYYRKARAFLFPCEDDFGLTIVESLRRGVPVIALRRGGAKEIIEEGVTGEFFDVPVAEVFADALRRFIEKEESYDHTVLQQSAERFCEQKFKEALRQHCEMIINEPAQ